MLRQDMGQHIWIGTEPLGEISYTKTYIHCPHYLKLNMEATPHHLGDQEVLGSSFSSREGQSRKAQI